MHACSVLARGERVHAKVAGLDGLGDVVPAHLAPSNQVFGRDQDPAVGPSSAARAARQAIELLRHPNEYGPGEAMCTRWTLPCNRDLISSMWRCWFCAAILIAGCDGRKEQRVALPEVAPTEVVVSWAMISREASSSTMYMALRGNRQLEIVTKQPSGTMMQVQRELGKDQYAELIDKLRKLDCCSLESRSKTAPTPLESQPELGINFGDIECQVALWDSEWRVGRARECGFAVAQVHGHGFVPDPPAVDPAQ